MHQTESANMERQCFWLPSRSVHSGGKDRRNTGGPGSCGLIMHIALQGCLKEGPIAYGLTADTGGHIRYLLELVEALSERPEVTHQIIVTRAFDAPHLGDEYNRLEERLSEKVTLWRIRGKSPAYLPKESLWQELPTLTDALIGRINQRGTKPSLIHAHYADAGVMAMRLKTTLSIPYAFTAHSLGATKAQCRPANSSIGKDLKRRIRYEELAIRHAARLIASSDHEAHVQYGLYRSHDGGKIRVNPPGCDLQSFSTDVPANTAAQIDTELRRYLRNADLPCLLAIARPVEKKNLCALVRAYGEHPELREKANLVIYAGTRRDIESGEPEARYVWRQILQLIDDYDLYGHVAYPKHHEFDHVPGIYQWAAQRRGVFVNPALNEPFGLTLLEAAAAGLPVVATQEGGPVDIVSRCGHGLLVAPTDTRAIAEACHRLLSNDLEWQRNSLCGRRNVGFYTWSRHASQYVLDLNFPEHIAPTSKIARPVTQLLATDMDGTLLGHRDGLTRLESWLAQNSQCLFVVATGRSVKDALRELKSWCAPAPDFLIADVGSSIYQIDQHGYPHVLPSWHRHLDAGWQRANCQQLLSQHFSLELQPESNQSAYKLSYFTRHSGTSQSGFVNEAEYRKPAVAGHINTIVKQIERSLGAAGLDARVVHSHGNLLDILPTHSGKAHAVDFVRKRFNIERQAVVAAGDSGNDIDLLRYAALGIVVANRSNELEGLRDGSTLFWAQAECAAGILEGLEHWHHLKRRMPIAAVSSPASIYRPEDAINELFFCSESNSETGAKGIESGA